MWYRIKCLPFIYSFQVDYVQDLPSYVIIIVSSQHLCWLHAGITVVCHNHRFIRSPNSKVGSLEIAKIKIAKIISHNFTFKSRNFSSAKFSRYTVLFNSKQIEWSEFPRNYSYFDASIFLLCLSIASKMMFWEGLTVISAQKHFQIKFINIAIYCNNIFDIAIYRNTFLGPQYPVLVLGHDGRRW